MKYILIFIPIFLITVSVFGSNNKGEVLFQWGEYPNYKWMEFGDIDTQPKYKGQVKNGKPNGLGIIIYTDGSRYVGGWENGKYQGQGTFTKPDGTKYVGSWKIIDGFSSHWNGEYYDKDGIIKYKWVNGQLIKQYKS